MKLTEYENRKTELGIEGTGVDVTTKREMTWTDKSTGEVKMKIPAGSKVHVDFSPKLYPSRVWVTFGDNVGRSRTTSANDNFTGFKPAPSMKTLERYSFDSVAKSVTGKIVEPDGYSADGSPSWLLVLGLI